METEEIDQELANIDEKEDVQSQPEIQGSEDSSEQISDDADNTQSSSEDEGKLEPWMARRLSRKDRQIERERAEKEMLRQQAEMLARQVQQYGMQPNQQSSAQQAHIPDQTQPLNEDQLVQMFERGMQKRQQQQYASQQAAKQADFRRKLDAGADKFDDFEDVVLAPHLPLTPAMLDSIMDIPNPDTFLYSVAKNQTQRLAEIARLLPIQQARAMGELVAEYKQKSKPKFVSKAPAPVASKLKTNSESVAKKDTQDMNYSDILEFVKNSRRR